MNKHKIQGVTLVEIMLVAAVVGMIMVMVVGFMQQKTEELRRNRVSMQIHSMLNAALTYYISNGTWPIRNDPYSGGLGPYLRPPGPWFNPWGAGFDETNDTAAFYVCTDVKDQTTALMVSGTLPGGYVSPSGCRNPDGNGAENYTPPAGTCSPGHACYVVGSVNIPGQNLNNASAVNFAGTYHPNACVPAPECPVDKDGNTMNLQIYAVPSSVSGEYDPGNFYPITSYTAYVVGDSNNNQPIKPTSPDKVYPCDLTQNSPVPCSGDANGDPNGQGMDPNRKYFRVCLQINTSRGVVYIGSNQTWAKDMTIVAFTRCASTKEKAGSSFNVFQ